MKQLPFLCVSGFVVITCSLVLKPSTASAANIVFSTLPAGGNTVGGTSVRSGGPNRIEVAMSFVPTEDALLSAVELSLVSAGIFASDATEVALFSSSGSGPGSVIESLGVETVLPGDYVDESSLTRFESASNPLLEAGTEYFIVALPDGTASSLWTASLSTTDGRWTNVNNGSWGFSSGFSLGLRVIAVPEPGSAALVSMCLLFGALRRRRHA